MIPVIFLGQAVLSLVMLASFRASDRVRQRVARGAGWAGIASGLWMFIARDSLQAWRGLEMGAQEAAVVGVALACTWGLVMALDLGADRWWAGALAGVAATGMVGFAAGRWTIPMLLFLGCGSAAMALAWSRSGRAGWLSLAASDAGLVAVLVADVVARDEWAAPDGLGDLLLVPLLVSCAVRAGLFLRLGPWGVLGRPAAVMAPLALAVGLVSVARWVERPLPLAGAGILLLAIAVAAWCVLRRMLDPGVAGVWPVALGSALLLISDKATVPASIAALVGMTVVCLWPDAVERGRLSRALVLSGLAPTIVFGAVGITAREAFVRATSPGDAVDVAAWVAVSALLPIAFASGVAVGIYSARSKGSGGYHPEAVFMTWVLLGASMVGGFVLGPSEVYGALGGGPAAVTFGIAVALGAVAALRAATTTGATHPPAASCNVTLGSPPPLGAWAPAVAAALLVGGATATAWITIRGLQQGFL